MQAQTIYVPLVLRPYSIMKEDFMLSLATNVITP